MKKLYPLLLTLLLLLATSCQHDEIWDKLNEHEQRIEELERQCRQLNANVDAMQKILTALQEHDYVTEVMKIVEDGVEIGYSITFAKGGTITIYHGTNGANGAAPEIGVKQADDGNYYWTSDGEWITDENGNRIPATVSDPNGNYVTPQFRVADGTWYVSYDNGNSWRIIQVEDEESEEFFQSVTVDSENLYLTLGDGTKITIPIISVSQSFAGKVISIMGDSISTFAGWVPVEDGHNLTHRARYPQDNLFDDVHLTWWHKLITNLNGKLGVNDSWAGSTVSNSATVNSGDKGPDACMASITRITNLGSNGTPDLIFFYGGTNDAAWGVTLGTFDPSKFNQVDLNSTTWSSFADAYATAIMRMQYFYPEAKIIAMTPTWTSTYYTAQRLDATIKVIKEVCDYFGVPVVDLRKCGINQNNLDKTLGDGIHPSALGMEMIEKYVRKQLLSFYEGDYTENVVYKVTNNLNAAVNLDRYIKGVSAGRPYTAHLSGDISKVGVKIGTEDITATAFNVATATIHIPDVTGDLYIDESGNHVVTTTNWYIDHTQNASRFSASCNTQGRGWAIAESNPVYQQLVGKPINTAAFYTNKQSQKVTVMKVPHYGATEGEIIAEVTATTSSPTKQLAIIYFPEVTLNEGEYLSLFSQEDGDIQFYYAATGVADASGVQDCDFYTRLPILYGSGSSWSLANMCLGWSFGYTEGIDLPWAGKKLVVMGDSITAGSHHGDSPIWYQALATEIGITDMYGSGVSGSAISTTSYYGTNYQPMVLRYKNLPEDGNLYIIFGGTNDYTLSSPLGTIDDVTDVSFYGALDEIINGLKKKVPDATIIFLPPLKRYGYGQTRVGKINLITPETLNDAGCNLLDYRQAIIDKCEQYTIPYIDVYSFPEFDFSQGQDGVSKFNPNAPGAHPWTNDGLHPNHLGHPALGKKLVPYINEIGLR